MDTRPLAVKADDSLMQHIPVIPEATCAYIRVARSAAIDNFTATVLPGPIANRWTSVLIRADAAGHSAGSIRVKKNINELRQQGGAVSAE
jgi:hypothetical protein